MKKGGTFSPFDADFPCPNARACIRITLRCRESQAKRYFKIANVVSDHLLFPVIGKSTAHHGVVTNTGGLLIKLFPDLFWTPVLKPRDLGTVPLTTSPQTNKTNKIKYVRYH